jgi:hypothetical protein
MHFTLEITLAAEFTGDLVGTMSFGIFLLSVRMIELGQVLCITTIALCWGEQTGQKYREEKLQIQRICKWVSSLGQEQLLPYLLLPLLIHHLQEMLEKSAG